MANYYVDDNGNITTKKKKKKKQTKADYVVGNDGKVTAVETEEEEDIAPVKKQTTTHISSTGTEHGGASGSFGETKRTWVDKGAFEDGISVKSIGKAILGTSQDIADNLYAGLLGMGEKAVDAGAYVVGGVGGLFGADKFAEDVKGFIAKDLYDEKALAKKMNALTIANLLTDPEEDSVMGDKTDSVIQSGGQLLGQGVLQAVGVPWFVTSGVTAFGGETEQAFNEGATYGEAGISGAISAGAEILTEKISGGIKFGGKTLDDGLTKLLARKISNKFVRNGLKIGADFVGEGGEEWLSEDISRFGQWLTYQDEKTLTEMLWSEEAMDAKIEAFWSGGLLGGGMGSFNAVKSKVNGVDYTSGLAKNEETVVNKVYKDRIFEKETDGKKLTEKEKAKIYDEVLEDIEKGYITTDTIEEILGGETYKTYKDTIDSETEAIKELEELYEGEELKTAVEDILNNSKRWDIQKQLSEEVINLAKEGKDNRILMTYRDSAMRGETFTADVSKYDEKYRGTVQKAIDSGILNNTRRTHEFVDIIAKISADKGVSFDFTNNAKLRESGFAVGGKTVNGYVTEDGIAINMDSKQAWQTTVGHEITHVLEGTEFYDTLQETIFEYAKNKNDYKQRLFDTRQLYKDVEGYQGVDGFKKIKKEVVADLVGEYLFNDTDFINSLSTNHRNVFQKVYDEIKYLCKIATAGTKEARDLERVRKAFEDAYRNSGTAKVEGKQYSLTKEQSEYFKDSKVRDEDGNLKVMYHGTSKGGHTVFDTFGESRFGLFGAGTYFTDSKNIAESYTDKGKGNNPQVYEAYLNIKNPMDMDAVGDYEAWKKAFPDARFFEGDTNEQFFRAMVANFRYEEYPVWEAKDTAMSVLESMGYDGITHIGGGRVNPDGERHRVYIAFYPEQIKNIDNLKPTDNPDIRYSLSSDSEGKKLTEGQEKYFKDSKMRDDNGNLTVMYHGSQDAGFHEFKQLFSDDGTSFFFVDNPKVAKSYSGTSETYTAHTFHTADDFNKFFAEIGMDEYEVTETDGKFTLFEDGDEVASSETAKGLYDEFRDWTGLGTGSANYKVYLNLKNPLVVDVEGRSWDRISSEFSQEEYDKYNSLTEDEKSALVDLAGWEDIGVFRSELRESTKSNIPDKFTMSLASAYKKLGENDIDFYGLFEIASDNFSDESIRKNAVKYLNTRDYAQKAKENGYDGVIFKNIVDNGAYASGLDVYASSTVAIAFESNQIKSVANPNPTEKADIRYSLSKESDTKPLGRHGVSASDLRLETGVAPSKVDTPTQESTTAELPIADIAPSEPTVYDLIREKDELESKAYDMAKTADETGDYEAFTQMLNRYNALNEQIEQMQSEETAQQKELLDSITDEDAPPETEAPYYDEAEDGYVPDDPLYDRNLEDVGNRKVKAYMYEHPEVKPFFQEYAQYMLIDLHNSIKGERWQDENGWLNEGWHGTKRLTTSEIAGLLDNFHYTYAEIEKGLNAIIEDNGAENNACSKRIEILLNGMLMDGWTTVDGATVPPNYKYRNLLKSQEINKYYKTEFDRYLESAGDRAVPADIAPSKVDAVKPTAKADIAPSAPTPPTLPTHEVTTSKGGNIRGQQTMIPPNDPDGGNVAEVLTEKPDAKKQKKRGLWSYFKEYVLDKGMVFERISKKTKNRELEARWNTIRYAEQKAQRFMQKGRDGVKSLDSIRKEVEKTGKTKSFFEYLYHKHNIDRMSLEERYDGVENKAVFGFSVTADVSREAVSQLEAENPEFKSFADDVYAYMNFLRNMMVDNGVISQETADLWAEMYPHYVPIHRVGDSGLNINVPLDTGRTGVNAPVKRATGGSSDILPLFDTMAERTIQTFKAVARNRFGVELKNALGSTVANSKTSIDEILDSIDSQDGLLKEGKNGRNPTFTVFENGERVEFEITEEMYDALKPKSEKMAYTNKVASVVSKIHKGLLTQYNPVFAVTNAIKDVQDILLNSQHPARTYLNLPRAFVEMATKGKWYTEYMDNGGEQNTYFDNETGEFKEKTLVRKVLGMPLDAISAVNNAIEMAPRLAEYIASREAGRSADVSMLDASRVTTNFSAGGDLAKLLNRNGVTFLNASIQGTVQQARNIREAKMNGLKGWVGLATRFAMAGLPALLLNNLLWDDDEEYDELSDYVKENYYVVAKYGDGQFVRIPKGRAVAVIQNAVEQIANVATGDDEADLKSFLELAVSNLAPNNPIDNNILAPVLQVASNKTWYGEDLVPSRLQDLPKEEQYDESTDAISKWLGEKQNFLSPYQINYLLNQYSGGIGDVALPMLTPEAERGDNSTLGNIIAPFKDKFTTDSVMNNQNISDFYNMKDEMTTNAKSIKATDKDILKSKLFNAVNADLADLYKQKREIQNSDLSDSEKYEQVREIQKQINAMARYTIYDSDAISIDENYATISDLHYRLNKDGEWQKVTDKQLEKQEKVTSGLGISASDYWGNKEEYDYAYEYPQKYAVAKSVGGYETYKAYSSELYDIKSDKDASGKSISGSRKAKVVEYINNLDVDYGEKLILFKSEYNADDTYNYEIIDYLNNRNDISREEMELILKELGFTVLSDGTIQWD